jgi:type IV secretory pathway TrbF-like protein
MKSFFHRERRSLPSFLRPPDPREEFFSLWANLGKQRSYLFLITLLALGALIFLSVSYVRLAHATRLVPFLYVVDRSGEVLALGSAHPVAADSDPVVYNVLETFITGVRAVFRDPNAERFILKRAYAFLPGDNPDSSSTGFLEAYMSANDPRLLAERLSRTADVVSILKLPPKPGERPSAAHASTWRIRWRETTIPIGTAQADTADWEAFVQVRVHPKTAVEAFDPNPFGVYIDHLSWSRLTPDVRQ